MPVSSIKKDRQPKQRQVDRADIPGYLPPANLAQRGLVSPRSGAVLTEQRRQEPEPRPTPMPAYRPPHNALAYRWESRFFEADIIKDDDGQHAVGMWLTDLEEMVERVVGVQAVYIPGGALVLAKVQELVETEDE